MHTPEQAKELWCPMVRHTGGDGTFNRGIVSGAEMNKTGPEDDRFICNCIADKCGMWRWTEKRGPARQPDHPIALPTLGPLLPSTHGYCGIAGRPEVAA